MTNVGEEVLERFHLGDRVAVITGAGSGIGRASAVALAGVGAIVICADLDGPAAEATAESIADRGGRAESQQVDVADRDAVFELVAGAAARHGRLDVMCNIAGTMQECPIVDIEEHDLDHILAVNLKGVLFGCQAAGRIMIEQGSGSIINMSSSAVHTPTPDIGPYAITKAAVVQLTRTMAVEVGRRGVRVNAVAPGFVLTTMTGRYFVRPDGSVDEELREAVLKPMRRFTPLRRIGEPEDIASTVLFLASDASSFMTGQLLSPNGGAGMH